MFETVAPPPSRRNRLVFYESLPVSVAIHTIAVAAIAFAIVNRIDFPLQPPVLNTAFIVAAAPPQPPPPPPPPPAASAASTASASHLPIDTIVQELAPTIIPDEVHELPPTQPASFSMLSSNIAPASYSIPGGVAGGVAGGVIGGTVGGVKGGVIGGVPNGIGEDGRVHIQKDAPLPMAIEARTYPEYPTQERFIGAEEDLVIRYIIGRDGKVSDVRITKGSKRKNFEKAAVDAIRQWRFRPLIVDGEPIEVVHEVTVYFKLF